MDLIEMGEVCFLLCSISLSCLHKASGSRWLKSPIKNKENTRKAVRERYQVAIRDETAEMAS